VTSIAALTTLSAVVTSYADVLNVDLENPDPIVDLAKGDHVTTIGATFPVWCVLAVHEGRAWVQRIDSPWIDGLTAINRLRRSAQVIPIGTAA
jgi:hypothetical protein